MPKRIVIIVAAIIFCLLLYNVSMFLVNKFDPYAKVTDSQEEIVETMAYEWPQFHGPNRDNRSEETGLLKKWPNNDPQLIWKYEGTGKGWSSPSMAGGYIYVTGVEDEKEFLCCLNLSGQFKWKLGLPRLENRGGYV